METENATNPSLLTPIGHDELDHEHAELLNLCLQLASATDNSVEPLFDVLYKRFSEHFATEDSLMAPHDFSSRQCHLDEHAAVLRSFAEVKEVLRTGSVEPAHRLGLSLAEWLPQHVDALDRHLTKFLFYRQTGGAPVLVRR